MKKIIIFSLAVMISSVSFAQTQEDFVIAGQEASKKNYVPICELIEKDTKNKNYSSGGRIDGSTHFCSFNRWFGSSYCESLGGSFKKTFFGAGSCIIGNPE